MRVGLLISMGLWGVIIWSLTGCSAIGVKEIDLWGARMEFSDGVDYQFGYNNISSVNNQRGLTPKKQYKEEGR